MLQHPENTQTAFRSMSQALTQISGMVHQPRVLAMAMCINAAGLPFCAAMERKRSLC